jgi:hypothetical protein
MKFRKNAISRKNQNNLGVLMISFLKDLKLLVSSCEILQVRLVRDRVTKLIFIII